MSSSISNSPKTSESWVSRIYSNSIPLISASVSIVPAFGFLVWKSCAITEQPRPKWNKTLWIQSVKAAPTVGAIVWSQMFTQQVIEGLLQKYSSGQKENAYLMIASSVTVAVVSAPFLAILNGQTMGKSIRESLKLSPQQVTAIAMRELFFILSLRVSGPVGEKMKAICGDNKVVKYGSAGVTGMLGAIAGHSADVWLTLLQNKKRITSYHQLKLGIGPRMCGLFLFNACYAGITDTLKSIRNKD